MNNRPKFPKRAIITAGMPYGSKELHFGHIGGVFVHADAYARFLKDRIGGENVIFVSGTDCYGSPIVEKYRQLKNDKEFDGTLIDFVSQNHLSQTETLKNYLIDTSLFEASAFGSGGEAHQEFSDEFFQKLLKSGCLSVMSTKQFYDQEKETFLNGRQVVGRCPIEGCKSEQAYADECALGHQYFPDELIAPKSMLSGVTPILKEVKNWYFDMERFMDYLKTLVSGWENDPQMRSFITVVCSEFLKDPALTTKLENFENVKQLLETNSIPFTFEIDENKNNCRFIFKKLTDREKCCKILAENNIRSRTGKTIVPFRISGNIDWGVKIPNHDDMQDLTFWVWPESLWAPISFTKDVLKVHGKDPQSWTDWWASDDSQVVQFIGEDNIYFYSLAEMALFKAVGFDGEWQINPPTIVANKHILFFDSKASSSGKIKPPMAQELLTHYSAEQLRAHYLGLGLGSGNVPFQPKPYNPKQTNQGDPVFKEWSIFTNFLNRATRTLFYTFQKYNGGDQTMPTGEISPDVTEKCEEVILKYEEHMHRFQFSDMMILLEEFFKHVNKYISEKMNGFSKEFEKKEDGTPKVLDLKNPEVKMEINQILVNALHFIKTATILSHPIAPVSTEKVREHLQVGQELFSWSNIFTSIEEIVPKGHKLKFLEPKNDFYTRPSWQY